MSRKVVSNHFSPENKSFASAVRKRPAETTSEIEKRPEYGYQKDQQGAQRIHDLDESPTPHRVSNLQQHEDRGQKQECSKDFKHPKQQQNSESQREVEYEYESQHQESQRDIKYDEDGLDEYTSQQQIDVDYCPKPCDQHQDGKLLLTGAVVSPNDKRSCPTNVDRNGQSHPEMRMTGGRDAANATVSRETNFIYGPPQDQVTKKNLASGHSSPQYYQQEGTYSHGSLQEGTPMMEGDFGATSRVNKKHRSEHSNRTQVKNEGSKSFIGRLSDGITTIFFHESEDTPKDYKSMYEQERRENAKKRKEESKRHDEAKKRHEKEKNAMEKELEHYKFEQDQRIRELENYKFEQDQRIRRGKFLEEEVTRLENLYKKELKKSNDLTRMVLEKRDGSFSTTEPPYDVIATKYESLFSARAKAVVDSYRPVEATKEEKKYYKKKLMKRLCLIFEDIYKKSKSSLLEEVFSEIFTPKGALQPSCDPDLAKTEVEEYGHLLKVFLKKNPTGPPVDKVSQMVTKYKDSVKKAVSSQERDGSIQLETFVRDAFQLCWEMLTVNPPMLIDTSETSMSDDTQRIQSYGVVKGMEEAADNGTGIVEFYKPVLYKNYLREIPTQKGCIGVVHDQEVTSYI